MRGHINSSLSLSRPASLAMLAELSPANDENTEVDCAFISWLHYLRSRFTNATDAPISWKRVCMLTHLIAVFAYSTPAVIASPGWLCSLFLYWFQLLFFARRTGCNCDVWRTPPPTTVLIFQALTFLAGLLMYDGWREDFLLLATCFEKWGATSLDSLLRKESRGTVLSRLREAVVTGDTTTLTARESQPTSRTLSTHH